MERRQLQTSASFSPAPWATFSPQTVTQWLPDGRARQWQELQSAFTVSRSMSLHLYTSLRNLLDGTRFRSRLVHRLPREFTLLLDYGRVSAFQPVLVADTSGRGISLLLRKAWRTPIPARGGEVSGRMVDELGRPVAGAGIRLGPYLVFTNEEGYYRVPRVPPGDYEVRIATESLPAHYAWGGASVLISVQGTARHVVNFTAIPLHSLHGHVYEDVNGNSRFDRGEGRPGMVLHAAGQVTATDADGAYGFYNLVPGTYTVRVDAERLGADVALASHGEAAVDLEPTRPSIGVDFRVATKVKPTVFQRIER